MSESHSSEDQTTIQAVKKSAPEQDSLERNEQGAQALERDRVTPRVNTEASLLKTRI